MPTVDELKKMDIGELIKKADAGDLESVFLAATKMAIEGYTGKDAAPEVNERYISYLKLLVDAGSEVAMIQLADAYAHGEEVELNPKEAIKYYEMAADNGISFGYECIGMMYFEGSGVSQDFKKAYEYFLKNKKDMQIPATYALGEMYRLGLYVKQDLKKACKYYDRIASITDPRFEDDDYFWRASYRLGYATHYGEGCKKDNEKAFSLIEKAKRLGRTEEKEIIKGQRITKEAIDKEWALLSNELGKL